MLGGVAFLKQFGLKAVQTEAVFDTFYFLAVNLFFVVFVACPDEHGWADREPATIRCLLPHFLNVFGDVKFVLSWQRAQRVMRWCSHLKIAAGGGRYDYSVAA
jgi:hypothetical protein